MIVKVFYVYTLRVSNENAPFYVGKGCGRRVDAHVVQAQSNHKSHKCAKIRKALSLGYDIITEKVFESHDEQECFDLERSLIQQYGRRDLGTGVLTNVTDGGEGASGCLASPETRQKLSASHTGRPKSPETRQKLSDAKKGHTTSAATRQKISAAQKGRPVSEATRAANMGRTISPETRQKMSAAQKGRPKSPEHCQKLSDAAAKYPRQEAADHIIAQRNSGMSASGYCLLRGIAPATFSAWLRNRAVQELVAQTSQDASPL